MKINFSFHGSTYHAGLAKAGDRLLVLFKDQELEKKFGRSMPFYVENNKVAFDNPNRSHSDLFALNSSISKAIAEQCQEMF